MGQAARRSPLAIVGRAPRVVWIRRAITKARLVQDPLRFLALEAGRAGRVGEYRLTELPVTVCVRHRSRDTDILSEMLSAYRPPPAVALPTSGTVLDVGGNIGLFALGMLAQRPGCRVISYEPDPSNLPLLARNRQRAAFGERWVVRPVAVSNRAGAIGFESGRYADSRVSASGDVVVPLVDIFEEPHASFMKIDIEGSEWDILRDARLPTLPADTVVLEWHRQAVDGTEGSAGEAARCLEQAGFTIAASEFDLGRDHGVIWAVRRQRPLAA